MAGFVDALRHTPFTGANFKRWQMRVTLWLTDMNVFWVSGANPRENFLLRRRRNTWEPAQSFVVR
jgi:hypothetical protein